MQINMNINISSNISRDVLLWLELDGEFLFIQDINLVHYDTNSVSLYLIM